MTAREKEIYQQYRRLKHQGWQLEDTGNVVRFNGGSSESLGHIVAKTVAAKVCIDANYRVQSEVETKNGDEADILAFGHESRKPIVVELENGLSQEVKEKKREQYSMGVREVYVISLDEWTNDNPHWLYDHIQERTGL